MDILNATADTSDWTVEAVELYTRYHADILQGAFILSVEKKYPDLKKENDEIRKWWGTAGNKEKLASKFPNIDVIAALLSDCRTDPNNCGRCAFHNTVAMLSNE